jgi:hypothetical protein
MKFLLIVILLSSFLFGEVSSSEKNMVIYKINSVEKMLKKMSNSLVKNKKLRSYRIKSVKITLRDLDKEGVFEDKELFKKVMSKIEYYGLKKYILSDG